MPTVSPTALLAAQALETAKQALLRIEGHETLCGERWDAARRETATLVDALNSQKEENQLARADLKASISKVHTRLDDLHKWLLGAVWAVAAGACAIVASIWLKGIGP